MNPFLWRASGELDTRDPLAAYRHRAMYLFAIIGTVVLLPFSVNAFRNGHVVLGSAILSIVVGLVIDGVAIHRKAVPPIPFPLLVIPMAASIGLSLRTQGILGAFWCYPAVLAFYFVLTWRVANLCATIVLVMASWIVYSAIGRPEAIRFSVSLTGSIIIINIVLTIIEDLHRRLLDQAITDPLTGVLNRRQMDASLDEAIQRNRRRPAPASLLLIDIDNFKHINDHFGHETGDRVLKSVVSIIGDRARKIDILFRMGGEEFVLLLPYTREADAANLAEQLRTAIGESTAVDEVQVTVSIGVAGLHLGDSREEWIKRADHAMYAAKHGGRNRVVRSEVDADVPRQ